MAPIKQSKVEHYVKTMNRPYLNWKILNQKAP